jgi:hypothetical protein
LFEHPKLSAVGSLQECLPYTIWERKTKTKKVKTISIVRNGKKVGKNNISWYFMNEVLKTHPKTQNKQNAANYQHYERKRISDNYCKRYLLSLLFVFLWGALIALTIKSTPHSHNVGN